jgi:CheY-like chemotaxis protein/two-component sensor histidine kinase
MRGTIERQSAQLMRLVDDMLDIARITRGTFAIERLPVDMAEVVERAVETARPGLDEGQHHLSVALPSEPLTVQGDLARLVQVFANLLANSARFTPPGGRIRLEAARTASEAIVSVRDNGRGIGADSIEGIFGMFVQGAEPAHRVGGGLGIGLALARRIVELHGGTIQAKSEGEGKGSEFTVRLPLAARQVAAGRPQAPAPARAAGAFPQQRILIVDDNADAADALDALLRSLGHETRVAYDGPQALKAAQDFRPDTVLLDIGLPGLSGYEVARRLRELKGNETTKIIAVTGWGQEGDRALSREAGFDVHLVKPVDEAVLRDILESQGPEGTVH